MYVLLEGNTRFTEYVLLGLESNTSSGWCSTTEKCFRHYTCSNLQSWSALHNQSLLGKLGYLDKSYSILKYYIRKDEEFQEVVLDTYMDEYPEQFI